MKHNDNQGQETLYVHFVNGCTYKVS